MRFLRHLCLFLALSILTAFPAFAQNHAPVAAEAAATTDEDTRLLGALTGSDADGDALSYRVAIAATNGAVSVSSDGSFVYYPNPDYNGSDSFTFVVSDRASESAPATVSITINPINDAPVATGADFTIDEDTFLSDTLSATDADGDDLTFRAVGPRHGTLVISSGGEFTYTPNKDFDRFDEFRFTVSDGTLESAEVTTRVMINPINDAPIAQPIAAAVPQNRTLIGQLLGFDVDRDTISYWSGPDAAQGTVTIDFMTGRFTYVPPADFKGTDSFAYHVSDGRPETSDPATVLIRVGNDDVGFLGDLLNPQVTSVDFPTGSGSPSFYQAPLIDTGITAALDQAVDRVNRRLYVLTASALRTYDIDLGLSRATLTYKLLGSMLISGTHLALSLDGRTAYVGGIGKVTAVNLFPESIYKGEGGSVVQLERTYRRDFPFSESHKDRGVAAMGVHPAGDRLFVVIDMKPSDKKLNVNNDLLRSNVGNGERASNLILPDDFGFITELVISADVQTAGTVRLQPEFSPPVNIKEVSLFPGVVALGIKSMAFSPDGNYMLLSAVGAQTPRATAFGVMPTSDEGTGGIVVVDVRPDATIQKWTRYLGFIPTTEKDEKTAELRREIQQQGWKIVHPEVQWARLQYLTAEGTHALGIITPLTALPTLTLYTVAGDILSRLEDSFKDYGYMQAYSNLYPRDMVGASGVAINHRGDFGVVTLQDTNNLGLLSLDLSEELEGYTFVRQPKFSIATGTGKSINALDSGFNGLCSWAYPQEVVFTSDDSRIFIGMAGGTPKAALTNKFGSADALMLRTERDRVDSIFKSGNPPAGYSLYGGTSTSPLKSPRQAATLQAFDSSRDLLSDQLKAYNRWNSLKPITPEWKAALVSTTNENLTIPGKPTATDASTPDCLDYGYFIPPSGVGYRLNTFGMPIDTTNFATRGVVTALEQIGLEWDKRYRDTTNVLPGQVPITRPYFIVGVLSQPGGGVIKNQSEEAIMYTPGTGSEIDFTYFTVGSDHAHDFVTSNGPDSPENNLHEITDGFDKENTEALIRLLLAQPRVKKIELDPYVLELIPGINDPRIFTHGSRTIPNTRRDLDNHMFVTFGCVSVDLDVDSDNSGVLDGTPGEDALEDQAGHGGKFIPANHGDLDADGIPDYADDQFSGLNTLAGRTEFTELVIRFPEGLELEKMKFRLIYSASDPAAVTRSAAPPYEYSLPETGAYRIWAKDGNKARVNGQINAGGDFIASNVKYSVPDLLARVDPKIKDRACTVYIESVKPGFTASERDVVIELYPDAGPKSSVGALTDTVVVSSVAVSLAVDANRDGQITFIHENNSDSTSSAKPCRFWLNDDDDQAESFGSDKDEERFPVHQPDWENHLIDCQRDLEDFVRLHINTAGFQEALSNGMRLGLKWTNVSGTPAIKIFKHLEAGGRTAYLTDRNVAYHEYAGRGLKDTFPVSDASGQHPDYLVEGSATYVVPMALLAGLTRTESKTHLLFEGCKPGKGLLKVVILRSDGMEIGEGPGVWLDLMNVKSMYERAVATTGGPRSENGIDYTIPIPSDFTGPNDHNIPHPSMGWEPSPQGYEFKPDPNETKTYFIYIHGWRWSPQMANNRTETVFKRLWHIGYKGRVTALRWPTFYGGPEDGDDWRFGLSTYNDSEYRAWKSGESLMLYVNQLPSEYVRNVVAHSMGNIVTGAALKSGMEVANYVLLNAAVPAMCYDVRTDLHDPDFSTYSTPNTDEDTATRALSYAGQFAALSTTAVNFFLSDDSATTTGWNLNNSLWKPQRYDKGVPGSPWGATGYTYDPAEAPGRRLYVTFMTAFGRYLIDPHEVMPYACQSLTLTAGAEGRTLGSLQSSVDMDAEFGFGSEHGAEWDRTPQETREFYRTLMRTLNLPVTP